MTVKSGPWKIVPGDPWNDRNVGSAMRHQWLSEACDCDARNYLSQSVKDDPETGYMYTVG